jgi:hypothetical protein
MFTMKILSQPIAVESEKDPKPKAKRVARKKKLSQQIAVKLEKDPKPKAKLATRKKKQD